MANYADISKSDTFIQSFTTRQHCTSNYTVSRDSWLRLCVVVCSFISFITGCAVRSTAETPENFITKIGNFDYVYSLINADTDRTQQW